MFHIDFIQRKSILHMARVIRHNPTQKYLLILVTESKYLCWRHIIQIH